jgi:chromosomal replication initiation ATPase DnaA
VSEPSIRLDDFQAVLDELCVFCHKRVRKVLAERLAMRAPVAVRAPLADLLTKTCIKHGMAEVQVVEGGNSAPLVRVRADFSVLAHNLGYSYPEIGKALHRHHTSIVHLVQKANGNGNNDQKSS